MMSNPMESTYQGYISSTHDALLIFECVRRGVMPKVKRRLREDERRLIRSGQVFVFDERESGIKRWTDGLLWSPSRILWNFLVYRQVDKKFGGRAATSQGPLDGSPHTPDIGSFGDQSSASIGSGDPFALGVDPSASFTNEANSLIPSAKSEPTHHSNYPGSALGGPSRIRSASAATNTFSSWQANGMVGTETLEFGSLPSQRDIEDERNLVGSLRSSYPFAKGGLCKKTISIQLEGTTQHLISYYTVDDVRSGRLRTPSSLPEIASLSISPIFLTKTSFRFPPAVILGPDGIPRFRGEEGAKGDGSLGADSSGEGTSSGSDSRQRQSHRQNGYHGAIPQHHDPRSYASMGQVIMGNRNASSPIGVPFNSSMAGLRQQPMSHQIGGSGLYQPNRRLSDAASRNSQNPHPLTISGGESSVSTSPSSMPATPYFQPTTGIGSYDALPEQMNQLSPDGYRSQQLHSAEGEGMGGEESRMQVSGLPSNVAEGSEFYRNHQSVMANQGQLELQGRNGQDMFQRRAMLEQAQMNTNWSNSNDANAMFKMAAPATGTDGMQISDGQQQRGNNPHMFYYGSSGQHFQQQQPQQQQRHHQAPSQRNYWSADQAVQSAHQEQHQRQPQSQSHQQQQSNQMPQQLQQQQYQHQHQHQHQQPWLNNSANMPPPPSSFILTAPTAMTQAILSQSQISQQQHHPQQAQHSQQQNKHSHQHHQRTNSGLTNRWASEQPSEKRLPRPKVDNEEVMETIFLQRPGAN